MIAEALLDSNVIIASISSEHPHHRASRALFELSPPRNFAIAAHSFSEAYVTLTRQGGAGIFGLRADEAWAALDMLRTRANLVGLTASQSLDTVRTYAAGGGIGARLYDALIGQTAVMHAIPTIITWNTRHMKGLFPGLDVATPVDFVAHGVR